MNVTVEINKRRPKSLEEVGVYMQGMEEGVKASAKFLVGLLGSKNKPLAKRRRI